MGEDEALVNFYEKSSMPEELTKQYVLVAKIIKPHGVRGGVKVFPYSKCPDSLAKYKELVLADSGGSFVKSFTVNRVQSQGNIAILQLEGVTTKEEAADLIGHQLWVSKADIPKLTEDEYYWFELKGLRVVTVDGVEVGVVTSVFNTKAHDILVVTGNKKEYLIPVLGNIVQGRDATGQNLIIEPMPGLLDLS